MDGVVCQAADRDEYLERSLFRQNGTRPIFYIPWAALSQKAKHEINGDNITYTALMETGIVSFKHDTYL